jgi:hypothetical protein
MQKQKTKNKKQKTKNKKQKTKNKKQKTKKFENSTDIHQVRMERATTTSASWTAQE